MLVANVPSNEEYYKLIPEIGKHLANSQNTDGAFRGVYLDDVTNKPCGAGEFVKVTPKNSPEKTGISAGEAAAIATICAAAVYGIAKAAPYVVRWTKKTVIPWVTDSAAPWVKQKWNNLWKKTDLSNTNNLQLKAVTKEEISNNVIYPSSRENMTIAEAQKELVDAYILVLSGYKKANRVANANVILPSGEIVDSKALLLNQSVIDQINAAIQNNPKLLSLDQRNDLSNVLGYDVLQQGTFHPITINAISNGIE